MSTISNNSGDNGDTGDKLNILIEEEEKSNDDITENSDSKADNLIGYRKPFFYCKEHPNVENIHRESIEQRISGFRETITITRWNE